MGCSGATVECWSCRGQKNACGCRDKCNLCEAPTRPTQEYYAKIDASKETQEKVAKVNRKNSEALRAKHPHWKSRLEEVRSSKETKMSDTSTRSIKLNYAHQIVVECKDQAEGLHEVANFLDSLESDYTLGPITVEFEASGIVIISAYVEIF